MGYFTGSMFGTKQFLEIFISLFSYTIATLRGAQYITLVIIQFLGYNAFLTFAFYFGASIQKYQC